MVVHVDADGLGYYLRNARINPIARRVQPCRAEQHRTAGTHRSRQEFSSRKTGIIIFQHTTIVDHPPGEPRWMEPGGFDFEAGTDHRWLEKSKAALNLWTMVNGDNDFALRMSFFAITESFTYLA